METHRIGFQTDALLAPQEGQRRYFEHAALRAPQTEFVTLDRAFGRILAQDALADAEYPSAPRSAMDGFAVRAADTPGRLRIAGAVRMGHPWNGTLPPGASVRIPTGGVVPRDADAVVPIEDAIENGDEIAIAAAVPAGDCITPAGSDMRAGELLLQAGRRIGGAELGLLATLGLISVAVYRRPVVAVLSSGDELVDAASVPGPGQIRDSNRWAIAGTLEALGAAVRHVPTAPDDPARLEALLREAVATADAVVLTGGSSVGEKDLTPRIVQRLGAPGVLVHGLRVKPGKPTVLAAIDGKPVIGLPGNPTSALMILEAVAAPVIRAVAGGGARPAVETCRLAEPCRKRPGWTWYVPVRLERTGSQTLAHPLTMRSSAVSLLARASGYLTLGEDIEMLSEGTQVRVTRFLAGGAE